MMIKTALVPWKKHLASLIAKNKLSRVDGIRVHNSRYNKQLSRNIFRLPKDIQDILRTVQFKTGEAIDNIPSFNYLNSFKFDKNTRIKAWLAINKLQQYFKVRPDVGLVLGDTLDKAKISRTADPQNIIWATKALRTAGPTLPRGKLFGSPYFDVADSYTGNYLLKINPKNAPFTFQKYKGKILTSTHLTSRDLQDRIKQNRKTLISPSRLGYLYRKYITKKPRMFDVDDYDLNYQAVFSADNPDMTFKQLLNYMPIYRRQQDGSYRQVLDLLPKRRSAQSQLVQKVLSNPIMYLD